MSSQVETLVVVHRRKRFLIYAGVLTLAFGLLGLLAWQLGYYPERSLQLSAQTSFAASDILAHQYSAHPVLPPLAFMGFLLVRNPIVLAALVAGFSIGYLAYFATTYAASPGIRLLLIVYVLLSPSMITLSLFQLEWLMMVALVIGSYAFVLEFCRRDSSYHLFMSGLSLAGAYLVVPETSVYAVLFAAAVTFAGPPRHRRSVYAIVILLPLLSAALGWAIVEWKLTGGVSGAIPDLVFSVNVPGIMEMVLTSGPFVLLYTGLCVVAGVYSKALRSVIIVLLIAPVALIVISLTWASPIPALVHVPLLVSGVIVLYPYFDTVVPARMLHSILALLIVAAVGRDTWAVFLRGVPEGVHPVTELVRGGEDRGNLDEWMPIVERLEADLGDVDRDADPAAGTVLLEGDAVLFERLVFTGQLSRMVYRKQPSLSVADNVRYIVRRFDERPLPRGFERIVHSGGFELLSRQQARGVKTGDG